ncbi:hypothetical protein AMTR_s00004p00150090 [Amborella trichopoda]|uniref:Uncharacterized protein n=1 Tax=Amborella trichopoda TaxID=13333 RepID=W1NE44_AMBTC|nr:hypothetical protein AMTR_s00004p00150090 [Amborella trichopoda]
MIASKKGAGSTKTSSNKPMFVQFVLEPLWQVYQAAIAGDQGMLEKVIKSFNLSIPARELQNKDPKVVLQAVMSRWLPLSDTILSMVVRCMPDPILAQSIRVSRLLPKKEVENGHNGFEEVLAEMEHVRESVEQCDSRDKLHV